MIDIGSEETMTGRVSTAHIQFTTGDYKPTIIQKQKYLDSVDPSSSFIKISVKNVSFDEEEYDDGEGETQNRILSEGETEDQCNLEHEKRRLNETI